MTCLKSTLPVPGAASALRVQSQPLTNQSWLEIEQSVIGALAILGRELFGIGVGMAPEPTASSSDAAEIEYASWIPDPGAIEMASWAVLLRSGKSIGGTA